MNRLIVAVVASFLLCLPAQAALIFSIDVDPVRPGIQSNISATPGMSFGVDVILEITEDTSIDLYGISVRYNTAELRLDSLVETPIPSFDSTFPISASGDTITGIEAGTPVSRFGMGPSAPPSLSFVVASLGFTAIAPAGQANDFDLVLFEGPFDGSSDNTFSLLTPVLNNASVTAVVAVPEPTATILVLALGVAVCRRRRSRCASAPQRC